MKHDVSSHNMLSVLTVYTSPINKNNYDLTSYTCFRLYPYLIKNILLKFTGMPRPTEVVISGIAGRFPECNSTEEFKRQLYNYGDLLTVDNRRWSPGKYNL